MILEVLEDVVGFGVPATQSPAGPFEHVRRRGSPAHHVIFVVERAFLGVAEVAAEVLEDQEDFAQRRGTDGRRGPLVVVEEHRCVAVEPDRAGQAGA